MKITTAAKLSSEEYDSLEKYRPQGNSVNWQLAGSGFWSEDMYHSGYIAYYISSPEPGTWVLDGVSRNAELDGVTQEDVDEGRLNDDQLQAMWGISLEEAQNREDRRVAAVATDVDSAVPAKEIARLMYDRIIEDGGMVIEETDDGGILEV